MPTTNTAKGIDYIAAAANMPRITVAVSNINSVITSVHTDALRARCSENTTAAHPQAMPPKRIMAKRSPESTAETTYHENGNRSKPISIAGLAAVV